MVEPILFLPVESLAASVLLVSHLVALTRLAQTALAKHWAV